MGIKNQGIAIQIRVWLCLVSCRRRGSKFVYKSFSNSGLLVLASKTGVHFFQAKQGNTDL